MSSIGDGGFEGSSAPERTVQIPGVDRPAPVRLDSVYDAIRELLVDRGWVQGRETHGERLSLTAAIDVVVGVDPETRAADGRRLARSGRVRRHLCELVGTSNLVAWNDDAARCMTDLVDLLTYAAVAYPDD